MWCSFVSTDGPHRKTVLRKAAAEEYIKHIKNMLLSALTASIKGKKGSLLNPAFHFSSGRVGQTTRRNCAN